MWSKYDAHKFIVYPSFEKSLGEQKVKSRVFLKSSLKFTFSQDNCRKSRQKKNSQDPRLVMSSIRVIVVAKTDDEIYVSSTIKCIVLSICFIYCPKGGRVVENIDCDVANLKIVTTHHAQIVITMQKW